MLDEPLEEHFPGSSEAMDGRSAAYMDVFKAIPGKCSSNGSPSTQLPWQMR